MKNGSPTNKKVIQMIHAIHVAFVAKCHGYFKSCGVTCL
jgi:hypothetical protein